VTAGGRTRDLSPPTSRPPEPLKLLCQQITAFRLSKQLEREIGKSSIMASGMLRPGTAFTQLRQLAGGAQPADADCLRRLRRPAQHHPARSSTPAAPAACIWQPVPSASPKRNHRQHAMTIEAVGSAATRSTIDACGSGRLCPLIPVYQPHRSRLTPATPTVPD